MTDQSAHIRFQITSADVNAFYRYYLQHSGYVRSRLRTYQFTLIFIGAILFLIFLYARPGGSEDLMRFPILLGVFLLFYAIVFFPWRFRRTYLRNLQRFYERELGSNITGTNEMRFERNVLVAGSPSGESRIPVDNLEKIVHTSTHTFLFLNEATAFIVPRERVTDGDYETFVKKADTWMAAADGDRP